MKQQYHDGRSLGERVSSELLHSLPRSPLRQVETPDNASNLPEYALSGAKSRLEPRHPSSLSRDAISYQELDGVATEPSPLATILQLHKASEPWAGRHLDPVETRLLLKALISLSLAFTQFEGLDGVDLAKLIQIALDAQEDADDSAGIDQATLDVLDKLGYKW